MTSSPIPAARSQYLLDLLAQVPDPRKRRGRRHALAGLLAVGIKVALASAWIEFAGAAQVAQLRRTVTKKGKRTVEVVYLITSDRGLNDPGPPFQRQRKAATGRAQVQVKPGSCPPPPLAPG